MKIRKVVRGEFSRIADLGITLCGPGVGREFRSVLAFVLVIAGIFTLAHASVVDVAGFGPWKYSGYANVHHRREAVFIDSSRVQYSANGAIAKVWIRRYVMTDLEKIIDTRKYQSLVKDKFQNGYMAPYARLTDVQQKIPVDKRKVADAYFTYMEAVANLSSARPVVSGRIVINCRANSLHVESATKYDASGSVVAHESSAHARELPITPDSWKAWARELVCSR